MNYIRPIPKPICGFAGCYADATVQVIKNDKVHDGDYCLLHAQGRKEILDVEDLQLSKPLDYCVGPVR